MTAVHPTDKFSLSRLEVAEMAGCSANHVYNEIRRGHLKAFFIGGGMKKKIRILREDAIVWITSTPVKTGA